MKHICILLTLLFLALNSWADFENYDQIVDKLSRYTDTKKEVRSRQSSSLRDYSMAHLGLGLAQTFYSTGDSGLTSERMQNQGGLLINVGVDLFNPRWGLEGSFANFGRMNGSDADIQLREFSLKALYKPTLSNNWNMRMGVGMSSRFLNINSELGDASYRTPSGLFTLGIDSYINSFISVGADLNFKTAMIGDTVDKNSVDLSFRVDTHF
jgi:hypothetical protein